MTDHDIVVLQCSVSAGTGIIPKPQNDLRREVQKPQNSVENNELVEGNGFESRLVVFYLLDFFWHVVAVGPVVENWTTNRKYPSSYSCGKFAFSSNILQKFGTAVMQKHGFAIR